MSSGKRSRIWLALCATLACGLSIGCDAGAASSSGPTSPNSEAEFVVLSFDRDGSWDVRRDEALVLRFSDDLDPAARGQAVRVIRRGSSTEFPMSIEVQGDTMILRPPAPFGFEADARYTVEVSGFPSLRALRSSAGRPLARDFRGVFSTSRYYGPDLHSPSVESVSLAQESGGHWSLRLQFSEPVNLGTVVAGRGATILTFPDDRPVAGRFIQDRTATTLQFLPSPEARPEAVRVLLGPDILDLAGNRLDPGDFSDTVIEIPPATSEASTGEIGEDFSSTLMMDAVGTTALWNDPSALGALLGRPRSSVLDLLGEADTAYTAIHFGAGEVEIRMLLSAEQLGLRRQITGLLWTPAFGGSVPAEYEYIEVRITPVRRLRLDQPGVVVGPTVTLLRAEPYTVLANSGGQVSVPFAQAYSFEGGSDLLLEIRIGPGTHTNTLRAREDPTGRSEVRWGAEAAPLCPAIGFRSYSLVPVATSRFYDSGSSNPEYFQPVLDPASMSEGESLDLAFQGARSLDADGRPLTDDPNGVSDWTRDVTTLRGYRYIRFRATFAGAGQNGEPPFLDTLLVPYRALR